jgi:hypothetical protein
MNALKASTPVVERVLDVDSHEMVPVELREEIFGHTELHDVLTKHMPKMENHPNRTRGRVTGDDTPITMIPCGTSRVGPRRLLSI